MANDLFSEYTVEAAPTQVKPAQAVGGDVAECVLGINTDSAAQPRTMFNARQPAYELKAERPEHRAIIMLKAAAMTNVEIAQTLGISPVTVAYVVKQPWAQKQILCEIESAGREPVIQLLQTAAYDAAKRLVDIATSAENLETKRKANNDILDRVFGKPNQPVTTTSIGDPTKLSEDAIDQRLKELYAKQQQSN